MASDHSAVKYRFILTELDLAITFCDIALSSEDLDKSKRNIDNARRAFDAATHFLKDADFSENRKASVQRKVGRLKTMLRRLNGGRYNFTET